MSKRRPEIEVSAGGVVYRREPSGAVRYLLIRDPYAHWGLPKGHLEDEETPAEAALRETAEETGLLIGKESTDKVASKAEAWSPFVSKQIRPSLSALTFVARAITPPKRPRRFDTRFFLADRKDIGGEIGSIVGPDTELVSLNWLTFDEALEAELPNITKVVVREIASRLESGEMLRPASFFNFRNGQFWRRELD